MSKSLASWIGNPFPSWRLLLQLSLLPVVVLALLVTHIPDPGKAMAATPVSNQATTYRIIPSSSLFRTLELLVSVDAEILSVQTRSGTPHVDTNPSLARVRLTIPPNTSDTLTLVIRSRQENPARIDTRFIDPALGPGYSVPLIISLLPFLWCLASLLFGRTQARIHTFAAAIHLTAAAAFPWDVRGWDVFGHVAYLRKLDLLGRIPAPGECWECYQPPFYYLVNVLPFRLGRILFDNPELMLAPFTCILGIASLWLGLSALKLVVPENRLQPTQLLYATFVIFILMAGKPNNDVFVLFFSTLALNLCWRWWHKPSLSLITWASLCCGLALLAKTTGAVVCASVGATILLRGILPTKLSARNLGKSLSIFLSIVIPIALVALWISVGRASNSGSGESEYVVGNISQLGAGRLTNDLRYYLYPNLPLWFDSIGFNVPEHPFFWNALVKSCIFGHHLLLDPWSLLGTPLMVVSTLLLAAWLLAFRRAAREDLLWAIPLAIAIAAVAAFRWKYPYVCSADFRYVSFAALPGCAGLALIPERPFRYLGWAMAGSQIAYFVGLYLQP